MFAAKDLLYTSAQPIQEVSSAQSAVGLLTNYSWTHTPAATENTTMIVQFVNDFSGAPTTPSVASGVLTVNQLEKLTVASGYYLTLYYVQYQPGSYVSFSISCTNPSGGYTNCCSIGYSNVGLVTGQFTGTSSTTSISISAGLAASGLLFYAIANTAANATAPTLSGTGVTRRFARGYSAGNNYGMSAGDGPGSNTTCSGSFAASGSGGMVAARLLP